MSKIIFQKPRSEILPLTLFLDKILHLKFALGNFGHDSAPIPPIVPLAAGGVIHVLMVASFSAFPVCKQYLNGFWAKCKKPTKRTDFLPLVSLKDVINCDPA